MRTNPKEKQGVNDGATKIKNVYKSLSVPDSEHRDRQRAGGLLDHALLDTLLVRFQEYMKSGQGDKYKAKLKARVDLASAPDLLNLNIDVKSSQEDGKRTSVSTLQGPWVGQA